MTIANILKRKMKYGNTYLSGSVRPKKVMIALNDLCSTIIYKNEQIVINNEWEKHFDQSKQNLDNNVPTIDPLDSPNTNDDLELES